MRHVVQDLVGGQPARAVHVQCVVDPIQGVERGFVVARPPTPVPMYRTACALFGVVRPNLQAASLTLGADEGSNVDGHRVVP